MAFNLFSLHFILSLRGAPPVFAGRRGNLVASCWKPYLPVARFSISYNFGNRDLKNHLIFFAMVLLIL